MELWPIPSGVRLEFADEIGKAIQASATFALILTPRWRKSKWAQDEYNWARRLGKKQFVLEFEETDPIFSLSSLTAVDCKSNRRQAFHDFLACLDPVIEKLESAPARTRPPQSTTYSTAGE